MARGNRPAARNPMPPDPDHPPGHVRVCALADLRPGRLRGVDGLPVVVGRTERGVFAIAGFCTHAGARLAKGRIVGECVECPLHGASFGLRDGAVRHGPARRRLACHDVEVINGDVYVRVQPRRRGAMPSLSRLFARLRRPRRTGRP